MKKITKHELKLLIKEVVSEIMFEDTINKTAAQQAKINEYEKHGYAISGQDDASKSIMLTSPDNKNHVIINDKGEVTEFTSSR